MLMPNLQRPSPLQIQSCCNDASDEDIWHNASVRQDFACHWGDTIVLKPGMYGSFLICVTTRILGSLQVMFCVSCGSGR